MSGGYSVSFYSYLKDAYKNAIFINVLPYATFKVLERKGKILSREKKIFQRKWYETVYHKRLPNKCFLQPSIVQFIIKPSYLYSVHSM